MSTPHERVNQIELPAELRVNINILREMYLLDEEHLYYLTLLVKQAYICGKMEMSQEIQEDLNSYD